MSIRNLLIDLIGLLIIALVLVVGYKLSPLLKPRADVVVQPDPACDLQRSACAIKLAGGVVEVGTSVRPIPLAKPFRVEVALTGIEVRSIEVDFAGIDMNMGFLRPALAAEGGGRYSVEVVLPVCVTGAMDWRATLLLESPDGRTAIPFRFRAGGS